MIDHIAISQKHRSRVTNCACERPYCNSDHLCVDAMVYTGETTRRKSRKDRERMIKLDTTGLEGDSDEAKAARAKANDSLETRRPP